jgi:hypothetical protein
VYCPNCGVEDRQQGQFCRACGIDLHTARVGFELTTGTLPSPAVTAREEIGRAVAAKIRDLKSAKELSKVVEEVLPEVEKFLEPPEERRLRRVRAGTVSAFIGLGATVFFGLFAALERDMVPMIGLGIVMFLIGLAMLVNAWLFTIPKSKRPTDEQAERDRLRDMLGAHSPRDAEARYLAPPPSVIEHTTRELPRERAEAPRVRATGE